MRDEFPNTRQDSENQSKPSITVALRHRLYGYDETPLRWGGCLLFVCISMKYTRVFHARESHNKNLEMKLYRQQPKANLNPPTKQGYSLHLRVLERHNYLRSHQRVVTARLYVLVRKECVITFETLSYGYPCKSTRNITRICTRVVRHRQYHGTVWLNVCDWLGCGFSKNSRSRVICNVHF